MKISDIALQVGNPNRVNISIDGKYRFSLDIVQITELGIKRGQDLTNEELADLETESEYGKIYARALEYSLGRPHSEKEVRDYLRRKTQTQFYKSRKTGETKSRPGISQNVADRVLKKLREKNYVNDENFARWWVETRNQVKGVSQRKLYSELLGKGVSSQIIDEQLAVTKRSDAEELLKVIAKKRNHYNDPQKLIQYLARQGFMYDDIKSALAANDAEN